MPVAAAGGATPRSQNEAPPGRTPPASGRTALAVALAALAGWVDATGFVEWHGLFVSFMSGNTTNAVVAATLGDASRAWTFGRAILAFLTGTALGEFIRLGSGRWERPCVLLSEALLLGAGLWSLIARQPEALSTALIGLAMGVQNADIHQAEGVPVTLTYFTGAMVNVSRAVAAALAGRGPWRAALPNLGLWIGLVAGALSGAAVAHVDTAMALAIAGTVAAGLALLTAMGVGRAEPRPS